MTTKTVYLDASVIVALFVDDPFSSRAKAFLESGDLSIVIADYATAEFASALARLVRMGELDVERARTACANLDAWMARSAQAAQITSADIKAAEGFLRRFDLNLRAPDSLHIAASRRLSAQLATFDEAMAASARALGVDVAVL